MCVCVYIYTHIQLILLHNWNSVSQLHINKICIYAPCLTLCSPVDCSLPGSSVHGILQGRILGCHFLLQRIFPTQGSNLNLLHCRQILYRLNHQRSPAYMYMRVYTQKRRDFSTGWQTLRGEWLWVLGTYDSSFKKWGGKKQDLPSGRGDWQNC